MQLRASSRERAFFLFLPFVRGTRLPARCQDHIRVLSQGASKPLIHHSEPSAHTSSHLRRQEEPTRAVHACCAPTNAHSTFRSLPFFMAKDIASGPQPQIEVLRCILSFAGLLVPVATGSSGGGLNKFLWMSGLGCFPGIAPRRKNS